MSGLFITLEGGEGSGKSTQAALLGRWLGDFYLGREIIVTREPGGTEPAEEIRNILVNGAADKLAVQTEALLMIAARTEHVLKVVKPALIRDAIVICDRFSDSTLVYQGLAHGQDVDLLRSIHRFGFSDLRPDVTFVLDLPPEQGLQRAEARAKEHINESRFENKGLSFHKSVRDGFITLAKDEPNRIIIVDASGTSEQTDRLIKQHLSEKLRIQGGSYMQKSD
jgi:dTMP kinase